VISETLGRVILHYTADGPPVTLTWPDVERLYGPEPLVAFDRLHMDERRDVVLCIREGGWPARLTELAALDPACGWHKLGQVAGEELTTGLISGGFDCRCLFWSSGVWRRREDNERRSRIRGQFWRVEQGERVSLQFRDNARRARTLDDLAERVRSMRVTPEEADHALQSLASVFRSSPRR
jgi:hypothetical protein